MTAAAITTTTPTPKQIRRQQRQSSPTYSDFVVFNNNKDTMMNTNNTVIDTTPLEDTNEWTSFNHPTDWKVSSSSSKSIATVKTADDDDEWTLFDDQSTAFNTNMGNDIVDKTTIIMSTTKSSSSSFNDGSTIGGGSTTTGSTTQRSVTTPSYTEKEYDIDTLVRIKQQAAKQQKQSKHARTSSSSSLAAASAAASVGCGSKASIQSILRKSSYTAADSSHTKSRSGSVTFDSVKSKTSTFIEELQTTCGQYFYSRGNGTVGINDILNGKCQDLLLTKEERKVDIDGSFLGKVISCATLNIPFDECGACGSSGSMMEMDDEDTAVSTLTEIRWSDDVVKK